MRINEFEFAARRKELVVFIENEFVDHATLVVRESRLFVGIDDGINLLFVNNKDFGEATHEEFIRDISDFEFTIFCEDDNTIEYSTFEVMSIGNLGADIATDFIIAKFDVGNGNFFDIHSFDILNLGESWVLFTVFSQEVFDEINRMIFEVVELKSNFF